MAELKIGQRVYVTFASQDVQNAGRVIHGEECEVTDDEIIDNSVEVRVLRLKKTIDVFPRELAFKPLPPMPGGYKLDDAAYYVGETQWLKSVPPFRLQYSQKVVVVGAVTTADKGTKYRGLYEDRLAVAHDDIGKKSEKRANIFLNQLSRTPPPPLEGGFAVGEWVHYSGVTYNTNGKLKSDTLYEPYKLEHAARGQVIGPSHEKSAHSLLVRFLAEDRVVRLRPQDLSYARTGPVSTRLKLLEKRGKEQLEKLQQPAPAPAPAAKSAGPSASEAAAAKLKESEEKMRRKATQALEPWTTGIFESLLLLIMVCVSPCVRAGLEESNRLALELMQEEELAKEVLAAKALARRGGKGAKRAAVVIDDAPSQAAALLAAGTPVYLHSLVGRAELNGRRGVVKTPLDPASGRVGVQVDGEAKPIAIRHSNLTTDAAHAASLAAAAAPTPDVSEAPAAEPPAPEADSNESSSSSGSDDYVSADDSPAPSAATRVGRAIGGLVGGVLGGVLGSSKGPAIVSVEGKSEARKADSRKADSKQEQQQPQQPKPPPPQPPQPPQPSQPQGYLFFANDKTLGECWERSLLGTSQSGLQTMQHIDADTPLLVFNFSARVLYGPCWANGTAGMNLEPGAWCKGDKGGSPFPAQIRVCREGRLRMWKLTDDSMRLKEGRLSVELTTQLMERLTSAGSTVAPPEAGRLEPRAKAAGASPLPAVGHRRPGGDRGDRGGRARLEALKAQQLGAEPPPSMADLSLDGASELPSLPDVTPPPAAAPAAATPAAPSSGHDVRPGGPGDTVQSACARLLDDEFELPGVAVYRKNSLEALAFKIEALSGDGGRRRGGGAATSNAASKSRKLAWDIVNKVVWRRLSKRSRGGGERSSGERPSIDSVASDEYASEDPVLPPQVSIESLTDRLRDSFPHANISKQDIAAVARDFAKRAADACEFAERQQSLWRLRIERGRLLSDRLLGVSLAAHPKDRELCQLTWTDQGEVIETVELWRTHVDALRALHSAKRSQEMLSSEEVTRTLDDEVEAGLVLTRMFTMVVRYDSLTSWKCAYQAALPRPVMDLLKRELCCYHECFASPLNQYLGSFCSAFVDTDGAFGSQGSFFDFHPKSGSFECNPPFDARSIASCLEHVLALLRASKEPLSFVLTVPTQDAEKNAEFQRDGKASAFKALNGFRVAAIEVGAKGHSYQMGMQHRRVTDGDYWQPDLPSTAYIFQNPAGRKEWPVRSTFAEQLKIAWDWKGGKKGKHLDLGHPTSWQ